MAPALAIAGMVARTINADVPIGEIFQPIVTGPSRVPILQREAGIMTDRKLWRNRKERKEWGRRLESEDLGLEVVHPHAAGVDVEYSMHYVAVRPDREPQPVRRFECFRRTCIA